MRLDLGTDASNTFEDLSGITIKREKKPVLGTCNSFAARGVFVSSYESTSRPVSPWSHSTEESDSNTDYDVDDNPYDLLIQACDSDPVCPQLPLQNRKEVAKKAGKGQAALVNLSEF